MELQTRNYLDILYYYGHLFTHSIFIKVTDQAGKNEEIEVIKTNQSRSIKESGMTEVLSLINIFK